MLRTEKMYVPVLANVAAFLYEQLNDVNWVGFYLLHEGSLLLGPFAGKPACVRIPFGKGVCGKAVALRNTQRVDDVSIFPGHIACDDQSKSEIVIPIVVENKVYGVLDIDSPKKGRFTPEDQKDLEELVILLQSSVNWVAHNLS